MVSVAGDGPGAEAAPNDAALQHPLAVIIVNGKPRCPHCQAALDEGGAVRIPIFEYAELDMRGDKIGASYNTDFDRSFPDAAQCAACHGELAGSGAWAW